MMKLIYITILLAFHVMGAEQQHTIPEQLAITRKQCDDRIRKLEELVETQTEQIKNLQNLQIHPHINPPVYTKFIPADVILAASLIIAIASSYQTYGSTGSIFLTLQVFCSNTYVFYACLKYARDIASVIGGSPLINSAQKKLKD